MNCRVTELSCRFDARASFYGKAQIVLENGIETLLSYSTPVVKYDRGAEKVITFDPAFTQSQTTLRHVKEYLKQLGSKMGDMTKSELVKYATENGLIADL